MSFKKQNIALVSDLIKELQNNPNAIFTNTKGEVLVSLENLENEIFVWVWQYGDKLNREVIKSIRFNYQDQTYTIEAGGIRYFTHNKASINENLAKSQFKEDLKRKILSFEKKITLLKSTINALD